MNKPTLWQRFTNWLSSIFNRSSTKKPEIVNQIVNPLPDGETKYTASFKSLYCHKIFTPEFKKQETKVNISKFDCKKTHYKFERPTFVEQVSRRFGSK